MDEKKDLEDASTDSIGSDIYEIESIFIAISNQLLFTTLRNHNAYEYDK